MTDLEKENEELKQKLNVQKDINKSYVDSVEKLKAFVRGIMDKKTYTYTQMEELLEL